MKTNVYTAAREIYGKKEQLNMCPVAFGYVPAKNRGLRRASSKE